MSNKLEVIKISNLSREITTVPAGTDWFMGEDGTGLYKIKQSNIIKGTAWTSYAPAITAAAGIITTVSAVGYWRHSGTLVIVTMKIDITTNGTGATELRASLPLAAKRSDYYTSFGRENALTGAMLQGIIDTGVGLRIQKYDNSYPGADGAQLSITTIYEVS